LPLEARGTHSPIREVDAFHPAGVHHPQSATKESTAKEIADDRQEIYDAYSPGGSPKIDPVVLGWIVAMHIGALAAPWFFTWSALGVTVLLHWLTCSIGICLMYHRCLSHRSLKLAGPVHFFATLCGVLSGEGKPLTWTAVHRLHHSRSDKAGDPHSPLDGPWWSHLYWMFHVINLGTKEKLYRRYTPDLLNDKTVMFFEKTYGWWLFGSGIALFLIGGLPFLFWGLCARMVFAYHSTWFVNSATHLWGYRNYETADQSRNLWWVAILSYGEGWHNNHHAHPHVAPAGHRWWEFDPTWQVIRLLRATGLATQVDDRIPTDDAGLESQLAA
jgi:stearoyl-CoA desaturase (delta-9 desaturase)